MALDFAALLREARDARRAGAVSAVEALASAPARAPPTQMPLQLDWTPSTARRRSMRSVEPVHPLLPSVRLVREWIDEREQDDLLSCIDRTGSWQSLRGRRVQCLGGQPGKQREPLPRWAISLLNLVSERCDGEAFNHVLVNEYLPGNGIEPHRDGPLYQPLVLILSLGSECSFSFYSNDLIRREIFTLRLPPRSLLLFSDEAYESCLHGCTLEDSAETRRVSLTIRRVLSFGEHEHD